MSRKGYFITFIKSFMRSLLIGGIWLFTIILLFVLILAYFIFAGIGVTQFVLADEDLCIFKNTLLTHMLVHHYHIFKNTNCTYVLLNSKHIFYAILKNNTLYFIDDTCGKHCLNDTYVILNVCITKDSFNKNKINLREIFIGNTLDFVNKKNYRYTYIN